MPQGVEHWRPLGYPPPHPVRIPLMPQGVEHSKRTAEHQDYWVRIPLMPQGVEHEALAHTIHVRQREDSIDAARR